MKRFLILFILPFYLMASIHVGKDEVKNGDVVCVGDTAIVEGKINGDLISINCNVSFSGKVNGDMIVILGTVNGEKGARVNGDMVLVASRGNVDGVRVNGTRVGVFFGSFSKEIFLKKKHGYVRISGKRTFFNGLKFVFNLFLWAIVSLLVLLMFQRNVLLASSVLIKNPWEIWVKGLIIFILTLVIVLLSAILSIVLIGIPFLFASIFFMLGAIFFGYTAIFYSVGKLILQDVNSSVYPLLVGAVLFSFLNSLYLVTTLVSLVVVPISFGLVYTTRFGKRIPQ